MTRAAKSPVMRISRFGPRHNTCPNTGQDLIHRAKTLLLLALLLVYLDVGNGREFCEAGAVDQKSGEKRGSEQGEYGSKQRRRDDRIFADGNQDTDHAHGLFVLLYHPWSLRNRLCPSCFTTNLPRFALPVKLDLAMGLVSRICHCIGFIVTTFARFIVINVWSFVWLTEIAGGCIVRSPSSLHYALARSLLPDGRRSPDHPRIAAQRHEEILSLDVGPPFVDIRIDVFLNHHVEPLYSYDPLYSTTSDTSTISWDTGPDVDRDVMISISVFGWNLLGYWSNRADWIDETRREKNKMWRETRNEKALNPSTSQTLNSINSPSSPSTQSSLHSLRSPTDQSSYPGVWEEREKRRRRWLLSATSLGSHTPTPGYFNIGKPREEEPEEEEEEYWDRVKWRAYRECCTGVDEMPDEGIRRAFLRMGGKGRAQGQPTEPNTYKMNTAFIARAPRLEFCCTPLLDLVLRFLRSLANTLPPRTSPKTP
ncbi:hypothetical protein C8J56DRAFT_1029915 [Mycena floridula]|nr:hypothetical protein C8J56DRAFT_1029915 [Mycena floridula]